MSGKRPNRNHIITLIVADIGFIHDFVDDGVVGGFAGVHGLVGGGDVVDADGAVAAGGEVAAGVFAPHEDGDGGCWRGRRWGRRWGRWGRGGGRGGVGFEC